MGKTLVRTSRRKYKKSAKGGKRTKRGRRVMKKSGRTKRRHMRGGWLLREEKECIKDIPSLSSLKDYIKLEWPDFKYKKYKKLFRDFDDTDAEKLRKEFEEWIKERKANVLLGWTFTKEPTTFACADHVALQANLQLLISKNDCKGVALYYLTILNILHENHLITGIEAQPTHVPDYRGYSLANSAQDNYMSARYGALAQERDKEAAARRAEANLNAAAP